MEEEKFLIKVIFFKRVMKCIKDHQCFFCGEKISTGSSYFISMPENPRLLSLGMNGILSKRSQVEPGEAERNPT